jgi:hypothetical protein
MGDPSSAVLLEKLEKQINVLTERIEMLKTLSAPQDKVQPLPQANPVGLLDLPPEIRLQIYQYYIPRKRIVEVSDPRFEIRRHFEEEDYIQDVEEENYTQGF